ncbi:hypothetical protein ABK040_004496 [Willaertia magna]
MQKHCSSFDSISLCTILEYLQLSSYLSLLLTCKEWNDIIINSKLFQENKNLILTLQTCIKKIYGNGFNNRVDNLVQKYKFNFYAIFYLLKKLKGCEYLIFSYCDDSLKNNKLIILNSFKQGNGEHILKLIPNKTLQKDFTILSKAYLYSAENGKRKIIKNYFCENDFKDFEFCNKILKNCINEKSTDVILMKEIKNKESICNYFKNHKLNGRYLQCLQKNILQNDEKTINELIIDNKNLSEQQLKFFITNYNYIFREFDNNKLMEFVIKRPILILEFHKELGRKEIIEICCKNPYILKLLFVYNNFKINPEDFIQPVIENNIQAFKYLPKKYRSIQLNKEMVLKVIERESKMIKFVCDLTFTLFEELCEMNEKLIVFKKHLCFKKE